MGTDLFSTVHILAPLPEKTRAGALGQFSGKRSTAVTWYPKKSPMCPFRSALTFRSGAVGDGAPSLMWITEKSRMIKR